jgi:uncharacterized protein YbjT (DUF2867 family)
MKKVLLFGATGHLGKEIARTLVYRGYNLTIAVRSEDKAESMADICRRYVIVDVCDAQAVSNLGGSYEVIISALGKSVSPNDRSKATFREVDLEANTNILHYALKMGVQKFVYVSAFHAEKYPHLEYFKVHQAFSERLTQSGIDYAIVKPPAIFSAFLDVIDMASNGRLVHFGEGDKKTNPIFEGDLAKVVVGAIDQPNAVIEAGGKTIYTRKQLNEIIQSEIDPGKKIWTIPMWIMDATLPFLRLADKNMYDKFAFFMEVLKHDTIAPQVGEKTFESYVREKTQFIR